jgi:hypothetical protein
LTAKAAQGRNSAGAQSATMAAKKARFMLAATPDILEIGCP